MIIKRDIDWIHEVAQATAALWGTTNPSDQPCLEVICKIQADAIITTLNHAISLVRGRRVMNRTAAYLAACDEIETFLLAALERVENGEQIESTAVVTDYPKDEL